MDPNELAAVKRSIKLLQADNARLTREGNELKRLLNDHAVRIDKNALGLKNLDRSLRAEMQRIASGFKNVKAAIAKITGGRV